MPDMNNLQHIHSAQGAQIQNKTGIPGTDYEHVSRNYLQNL